jgi:hypothetical protein
MTERGRGWESSAVGLKPWRKDGVFTDDVDAVDPLGLIPEAVILGMVQPISSQGGQVPAPCEPAGFGSRRSKDKRGNENKRPAEAGRLKDGGGGGNRIGDDEDRKPLRGRDFGCKCSSLLVLFLPPRAVWFRREPRRSAEAGRYEGTERCSRSSVA